MFTRIAYILLLIVALFSCRNKDTANTIISGVAPTYANSKLFIYKTLTKKDVLIDSAVVDSLGNFTFRLTLASPDFFKISNRRGKDSLIVIASPKEQIDIAVSKGAFWRSAVVKGSSGTNYLRELNDSLYRFESRIKLIQQQFDTLKYSYKYDSLRHSLKQAYSQDYANYRSYLRSFAKSNSGSLASIVALYQKQDSTTYFLNTSEDVKLFLMVDSVLYRKYPESSSVRTFHGRMEEVRTQLNNLKLVKESVPEGELAPNFTLRTISGDTLMLSSYKGKYVLLEFWASWATPSVKQSKYLPQVYAKYKPYGFEIIQVSLDRNMDELQKALTPEMRQWKHVSEFKMWNSSIVKEYKVGNIPSNFLINRQGIVVAKNVLNSALYDTLRWYLVRPYLMRRDSIAVRTTNNVNTSD